MQQQPHPSHSPTVFRPIVPAPPPMSMLSPAHSPLTKATPQHHTHFPPFETPPVSPFSNPNPKPSDQSSQPFNLQLPPPSLPPISVQQPYQPPPQLHQSSSTRYEPTILPKQGPSTSVFSIPLAPQTTGLNTSQNSRPIMSHHTSVIHPQVPHHHRYSNVTDKTLTTADQRELQRKVSHSAIERRRRERINDKIMQLKDLIPCCADQDHLHKLNILQNAIDYIQYLQGLVVEYRDKTKGRGREDEDEGDVYGERSSKRSKFDKYKIPRRVVTGGNKWDEDAKEKKEEYKRKNSSTSTASINSVTPATSTTSTASPTSPTSPSSMTLPSSNLALHTPPSLSNSGSALSHSCASAHADRFLQPPPLNLDEPSRDNISIEGWNNISQGCEYTSQQETHVLLSLSSSKNAMARKNEKREAMDIDKIDSITCKSENGGSKEHGSGSDEKEKQRQQQQQQQELDEEENVEDVDDDEDEDEETGTRRDSPRCRMNIQRLLLQDTHSDE